MLDKAQRTLDTARTIAAADPNSAYTLAYEAARHAGTALLAQQGLRPTSRGGHYALERALRGQFGQGFRAFGTMRRRRNELEYPDLPDESAAPMKLDRRSTTHRRSSMRPQSCCRASGCSDHLQNAHSSATPADGYRGDARPGFGHDVTDPG